MALKSFIFDLDGVITDTAKYHYLAWKRLASELKLNFNEENNELLKGVSRIRSFEIILELNNAQDRFSDEEKEHFTDLKNEYYKEYVERITEADILKGIPELIAKAREKGINCALASVSKNAPRIIELLGISESFDYVADAGKIKNSKPDPEIFLNCAESLGSNPCECVAFEDSQAGIEAIHSANMLSVGIGVAVTSVAPDYCLKSTSELDFDKIVSFYNEHQLCRRG